MQQCNISKYVDNIMYICMILSIDLICSFKVPCESFCADSKENASSILFFWTANERFYDHRSSDVSQIHSPIVVSSSSANDSRQNTNCRVFDVESRSSLVFCSRCVEMSIVVGRPSLPYRRLKLCDVCSFVLHVVVKQLSSPSNPGQQSPDKVSVPQRTASRKNGSLFHCFSCLDIARSATCDLADGISFQELAEKTSMSRYSRTVHRF